VRTPLPPHHSHEKLQEVFKGVAKAGVTPAPVILPARCERRSIRGGLGRAAYATCQLTGPSGGPRPASHARSHRVLNSLRPPYLPACSMPTDPKAKAAWLNELSKGKNQGCGHVRLMIDQVGIERRRGRVGYYRRLEGCLLLPASLGGAASAPSGCMLGFAHVLDAGSPRLFPGFVSSVQPPNIATSAFPHLHPTHQHSTRTMVWTVRWCPRP
jgi:hypothetical protein